MLMLSRNIGKAVIIGGNIRVTVAQINGCQVRLGIDAPRGVIIDREEIHQRRIAEGTVQNASEFNVDDHVSLANDARRYRWLRDQAITTDSGFSPAVYDRAGGIGTVRVGEDLDQRIDCAIRNFTCEQAQQEQQEQQP
ncbi:carbon storage regulator [Pseudomonas fulva]|uniref:carbon storage regulator n=1 Tax=Pseudomonas fulva TaxID=47880 RepID=UPI0024814BF1|nr:carbon storage regulator [Pseudomonas fulva]MEC4024573.1 carbon storage regulator [Pseudomonas fulva]